MMRAWLWQDGVVSTVAEDGLNQAILSRGLADFIWIHFQGGTGADGVFERLDVHLTPAVMRALVATETRPRCEPIDHGVLLNLRAPLANPVEGMSGDMLGSVRIWAERGLLLSVALRHLSVLPVLDAAFAEGKLRDPGDLVIAVAAQAANEIDATVAGIGDQVDELECMLDEAHAEAARSGVGELRSRAIRYRRFVVPQRQALERLALLDLGWIDSNERAALREAADQFARMGEELESIRERSAVVHEELTDLRAERLDVRSLRIAIAATIFLPLTFITGLLGMNVNGIPFSQSRWAFAVVCAVCVALSVGLYRWIVAHGWDGR